jgi:ABC-type phosphate transport system substrate-binding protein
MAVVFCTSFGFDEARAQGGSVAFGAGATGPQIAYRQLMDCMYNQAQGGPPGPLPIAAACSAYGPNASGFGGLMLYAPAGSQNGKLALRANNPSLIGPPSNPLIPYTSSNIGINATSDYDGIQFAFSDEAVSPADMAAWSAAGNPAKFGNLIQFPALIEAVAIGFNSSDGNGRALNVLPAVPAGGSSGFNLSRNALCGIVSGHITKWNNPILTALNGGVLGAGDITFVHRGDSDGTSLLLSNALATQCQFELGPNSETDATTVSYSFPWTDRTSACPRPVPRGASQSNWPDQFPTDQCGHAVSNPGGGHFANAQGGGVVALVAATPGAIGYDLAGFWQPVTASTLGGLPTANIEAQWDVTKSTGQFQPPTWQAAARAMERTEPDPYYFDPANPVFWSRLGIVANPDLPGAYPISGFSWIEMYQCYQNHANGNNSFGWFRTWLDFLYGDIARDILHANGFAEIPSSWNVAIYNLLQDPRYQPNQSGLIWYLPDGGLAPTPPDYGCDKIPGAY